MAYQQGNTGEGSGIDPTTTNTDNAQDSTSNVINQFQTDTLIAIAENNDGTGLKISGILDGLPVAEKNQEYFAVIKEVGDTSPELIGQSQFKVTYICDSQLNVAKPSTDTVALTNITQNFERQKYATVRVDEGTVLNQQLAGTHKITAVGSIEPIGGTQIGVGPYEYVTTMSFLQEGQLGAAPGVQVATYYMWLNKSQGFQNSQLTYRKTGINPYNGGAWSKPASQIEVPSASSFIMTPGDGFRPYFDVNMYPVTGSGTEAITETTGVIPSSVPAGFDSTLYSNTIQITTSSLEGNTRVRLSGGVGILCTTCSVADIFLRYNGEDWSNYSTEENIATSQPSFILRAFKEDTSGNKTLLRTTVKTMDLSSRITNQSSGAELDALRLYILSTTPTFPGEGLDEIYNIWNPPGAVVFPSFKTDYIDVEVGDKFYMELKLPYETASWDQLASDNLFTQSLNLYEDVAAYRTYEFFGGNMIVSQETPSGSAFINGVSGVTASYIDSDTSASIYNQTGSYWVGYTNFSSSEEGIGSFITGSTPLTNFYGGEYIQVNPGTEDYNVVNANATPSSSLFVGGLGAEDKKTWNNFGFNPIRLPFTPKRGDFIRFEYSKQKTYQITGVQAFGNTLTLRLDGQITPSTILDNFVIYRIVENGQYIILDVEKNNEVAVNQLFTGIVSSEFPSSDLNKRADQLIYDLKTSNIIET